MNCKNWTSCPPQEAAKQATIQLVYVELKVSNQVIQCGKPCNTLLGKHGQKSQQALAKPIGLAFHIDTVPQVVTRCPFQVRRNSMKSLTKL